VADCLPGDRLFSGDRLFTRRQIVYQATDCLPGGRFHLKNGKETTAFFTGSFLGFIFYCKFAGYKNINFGGTNNENQKS